MSAAIPHCIPSEFSAGTTVKYRRSLADYSAADGWGYTIYLAGAATLNKGGTADGSGFLITLSATDTDLTPGTYRYVERVAKAGEVYDVGTGVLEVTPNLATATNGSAQTFEEKQLAVIESVLAGRMVDGIDSYQIAGRAVTKIPLAELYQLRGKLRAAVYRQRNPGMLGPLVEVHFGEGE